jgi:hypothetical protein
MLDLDRAQVVWKQAQVFFQMPSFEGKPEARVTAERIAIEHPEYENDLLALLHHENQLVVAYTLLTLQLMGSTALKHLPEDLLQRRNKLTVSTESFKQTMDLGGFARQVMKMANKPL